MCMCISVYILCNFYVYAMHIFDYEVNTSWPFCVYVALAHRLPMAERVGCGIYFFLWSVGVWEVVVLHPGRGNSRVFHPARKLERFSLSEMRPSLA